MGSSIVGLAVLLTGISVGWQKLDQGGYVYIIQIEPEILESLKAGQMIQSDLPPNLRGIRSYRILVGRGAVPQEAMPDLPEEPPVKPQPSAPLRIAIPDAAAPLAPETDSKPRPERSAIYLGQAEEPETSEGPQSEPKEDAKPWPPFVIALALLLASLSGNVYMGWITWETRGRYRRLLRRFHEPRDAPASMDWPEATEQADLGRDT